MRPQGCVPVFAAIEVPDSTVRRQFAQPLKKQSDVIRAKRVAQWEIFVGVGEREKPRVRVELLFVHEPNGPLAGALKAAPDALAARNFDGKVGETVFRGKDDSPFAVLGKFPAAPAL